MNKADKPNYWIFQGNPKIFNIVDALKNNEIETWRVSAHKTEIKKGDKVILWVTGASQGCYALAEVTSTVYEGRDERSQMKYYADKSVDEISSRVKLQVTHNLVDSPILKAQIDSNPELSELNVGSQGTNFTATEEKYNAIIDLIEEVKNSFSKTLSLFQKEDIDFYFKFLKEILNHFQLKIGDERLSFSCKRNRLSFIVGQRYSWNLFTAESRGKYGVITSEKIKGIKHSEPFDGNPPQPYFNRFHDIGMVVSNKPTIFDAIDKELKRTSKSSFRRFHDTDFENAAYEMNTNMNLTQTKDNNMKPQSLNTIFYGPPGTGKTFHTILRAAEIIENKKISDYKEAQRIFNANLGDRIEFITFHQNYSYEDFIQGLRPNVEKENKELRFERSDGVFKRIADRALKNLKDFAAPNEAKRKFEDVFNEFIQPLIQGNITEMEIKMKNVSFYITEIGTKSIEFRKNVGESKHSLSIETLRRMYDKGINDIIIGGLQFYYNPILTMLLEKSKVNNNSVKRQNYVIIIDEINRANISRVFGELITLIEPDKRSHGKIPLKCTLPSGEEFIVPSNLFIIGAMNTADKSIALLDIALRRRFVFEAMYPLYEIAGEEIFHKEVLKKLNAEIIKRKGHDFQIGHSYFMGDNKDLPDIMNRKVIPLLLEYFMNDETEVKQILKEADLVVKTNIWPLEVEG